MKIACGNLLLKNQVPVTPLKKINKYSLFLNKLIESTANNERKAECKSKNGVPLTG